jgi:hypothetical protein
MSLTDMFKKGEKKEEPQVKPQGKYNQACALCGAEGTDKKWAGQYWHKKCMRKSRKMARGMF